MSGDGDYDLMRALEESAKMHQATIDAVMCSRSFDEISHGQVLRQLPTFNQFHPRWNVLIERYGTASAICGYTASACACLVAERCIEAPSQPPHLMTMQQVQSLFRDLTTIDPIVEDAMRFVSEGRKAYMRAHPSEFPAGSSRTGNYLKAWVANYEISDYLRSRKSELKRRLLFVRYNQYGELADATHEEKARLLADEASFDGSPVLVETFLPPADPLSSRLGPQLYRPEQLRAAVDHEWVCAVVDVNGHFAVAVRCGDGCALFNTTDSSYLSATSGGPTTALAFALLQSDICAASYPAVHHGVTCDASGMNPIIGTRYHKIGADYDLCEAEFTKLSEADKSMYEKIDQPHSSLCAQGA
jgi:hypothetical protein